MKFWLVKQTLVKGFTKLYNVITQASGYSTKPNREVFYGEVTANLLLDIINTKLKKQNKIQVLRVQKSGIYNKTTKLDLVVERGSRAKT